MTETAPFTIAQARRVGVYVPDLYNRVSEGVSEEAANELSAAYGGRLCWVPRQIEGGTLQQSLSPALVAWLVREFPGESVEVPTFGRSDATARIIGIRLALLDGEPRSAIAQRLKCHARTIRRHVMHMRANGLLRGKPAGRPPRSRNDRP